MTFHHAYHGAPSPHGAEALPPQTERAFMRQLVGDGARHLGLASLLGWASWHDRATNAPRACPHCKQPLSLPRNDPGWPDLLLLRGETLLVVETKSDRGRVTPGQQGWLDAFRKVRRVVVAVWRPRDWPAIERLLA